MTPVLALVCWVVGAASGLTMLVGWLRSSRTPPPTVYRHLATAVTGLVLWVAYLAFGRPDALAWAAWIVLVVANVLGDTLMVRGHRIRRGRSGALRDYGGAALALVRRPLPCAHALLAAVTFFSVLLAALGVGTDP